MRKGIQTSEFWVALSGVLILVWKEIQSKCNFDYAFLLSVGGVAITYILGRSWVKARQNKQPEL